MRERIDEKTEEIKKYLEELISIFPISLEEYLKDFKTKAACERYFEKIVEAIIDLAFFIIREKEFQIPEDEESSFQILFKENVISEVLAKKLKAAKGMRNIIAHEYGSIDNELVFHSVTEELNDDEDFIKHVEEFLGEK